MSAKKWVGGVRKITIFVVLQYNSCWRRWMGGPKKEKKKHADVIYGSTLSPVSLETIPITRM